MLRIRTQIQQFLQRMRHIQGEEDISVVMTLLACLFFFFFFFFRATYRLGVKLELYLLDLHHSHMRSELRLQPTPQLMAMLDT